MGPRPFLVKSLKGDWDQKCFQDNKNFETVIYIISFTFRLQSFSWFWSVDLEIWSLNNPMNIYTMYVTSKNRMFRVRTFALILCNSRTK